MPGGPPDRPEQGNPTGPGFRPADPAQMQELMMKRLQEDLKASEEEWGVMMPLVSDVMKLQRSQIRSGLGMGPGGPGGPDGPGRPGEQGGPGMGSADSTGTSSPEATELKTTIDKENSSKDEIQAKLTAFRQARVKQEQALKAAREKLRTVLTVRQEAILVLSGLLE